MQWLCAIGLLGYAWSTFLAISPSAKPVMADLSAQAVNGLVWGSMAAVSVVALLLSLWLMMAGMIAARQARLRGLRVAVGASLLFDIVLYLVVPAAGVVAMLPVAVEDIYLPDGSTDWDLVQGYAMMLLFMMSYLPVVAVIMGVWVWVFIVSTRAA
ncbi:MAG: hypothetical protein AB8H79_05960 [Myxococcota bacterium]